MAVERYSPAGPYKSTDDHSAEKRLVPREAVTDAGLELRVDLGDAALRHAQDLADLPQGQVLDMLALEAAQRPRGPVAPAQLVEHRTVDAGPEVGLDSRSSISQEAGSSRNFL